MIIPFRQSQKVVEKKSDTSFCLTNNGFSYGSMLVEDDVITFVLINLSALINLSNKMPNSQVFGGFIENPGFPMIYDEGKPVPFLLNEKDSLRIPAYDIKDGEPIGTLTILTRANDTKNRVNIFLQRIDPYDLDGFMWGIDHIYIDCKDCPVYGCPSRGTLPWKNDGGK